MSNSLDNLTPEQRDRYHELLVDLLGEDFGPMVVATSMHNAMDALNIRKGRRPHCELLMERFLRGLIANLETDKFLRSYATRTGANP